MTKILTASITNAPADILSAHLSTVKWQEVPDGVAVDHLYLIDPDAPEETWDAFVGVDDISFEIAGPKPKEAIHEVDEERHHWSQPTFEWLAHEKQRLLDRAEEEGYDAIWLVDSDLLVGPDTLGSLLAAEKDVVSAVFWTAWQRGQPPLPQCWLRHPYNLDGKGLEFHEFIEGLAKRRLLQVGGLGACTLIRREVLDRVGFYPLLDGLPAGGMAEGEDRHFCARAARNHVDLYADSWPDIFHIYFPKDRERIEQRLKQLMWEHQVSKDVPVEFRPRIGDLISLTIEPCEEPQLAGHKEHIRGRLGQLDLLPDTEDALLSMTVGDDRFVKVRYPMWWPISQYRGQQRTLRIRLLGAKPFAYTPTLDDAVRTKPLAFVHDSFFTGDRNVA